MEVEHPLTTYFRNSLIEQNRLALQHTCLHSLTGKVFHAPVVSPKSILDIGCGVGTVTRYLSSYYPEAQTFGVDLSKMPSQPGDIKLPNFHFIQGNFRKLVREDPRIQSNSKDFVFSRLLIYGITDWPGYVQDIYDVLKPGGWVEIEDYAMDLFYRDQEIVPREDWEWLRLKRLGGAMQGFDMDVGLNAKKYMEDAGFVDIQRKIFRIPFWRIPGAASESLAEQKIGDKWGLYWHMYPKIVAPLGLSQKKINSLRLDMRRDLQEEFGKEQFFCITIGRKPTV